MDTVNLSQNFKHINRIGMGVPLLVIMMLAMMVLPLPPLLLDIFFTFNIALSLVVLLACIYTQRALDFSIFPTILLFSTLLRLSLNIASTRVVLLNGHNGTHAAGQVVQSFGSVLIGSNYTVGLVVFSILVIINFVVVTKGSGRISEVTARFTLDAMPGKQMAIDADLNAGLIDQATAKKMRQEIGLEADFYGAMDGSSKFIRGDAIAGLLVMLINLVGGLIIGMAQHSMSLQQAVHNYSLLTIGDGLVAQIPSLLLSTAAAIIVTRVTSSESMGGQMKTQLLSNPRTLGITAAIMGLLGIVPGMPHLVFLSLAAIAGLMAYFMVFKQDSEAQAAAGTTASRAQSRAANARSPVEPHTAEDQPETHELDWNDVTPLDVVGLEIGYRLITLVNEDSQGQLMHRIKGIRKKLSQELGFLVPAVHIRDNLDLKPTHYRIVLMGVNYGGAEIYPDKFLAINPGQVYAELDGERVKDPTFGMDAVWITAEQRDFAQSQGYTVVDPSTVVATHLSHILQNNAASLLGHEETQKLLDRLAKQAPKLVEALTPSALPLSTVVKVLQQLLEERIPLVDIRRIAETLIENAPSCQDPAQLTNAVRVALRRLILQRISGDAERLSVVALSPELEQILQQSLQVSQGQRLGLEPGLAEKMLNSLKNFEEQLTVQNKSPILIVAPMLRSALSKLLHFSVPDLHVLSFDEVPDDKQLQVVGVVGNA